METVNREREAAAADRADAEKRRLVQVAADEAKEKLLAETAAAEAAVPPPVDTSAQGKAVALAEEIKTKAAELAALVSRVGDLVHDIARDARRR